MTTDAGPIAWQRVQVLSVRMHEAGLPHTALVQTPQGTQYRYICSDWVEVWRAMKRETDLFVEMDGLVRVSALNRLEVQT